MTARFAHLDALAARLVADTLSRPETLGGGRLVCVDGPAGSGKTTLAAALDRGFRDALRVPGGAAGRTHVRLLHMDNLYDGWAGLEAGIVTLATQVVNPLRAGAAGGYRRFDWHRSRFAEHRSVAPVDVLLVEGVGAGASALAGAVTLLVWVDTPPDVRRARWLARDGVQMTAHQDDWQRREDAMFTRERTRERADVVVDGTADGTTDRMVDPCASRSHD